MSGLAIIIVLLIALPSSFNQPQANPATTLEYAPVPPDRNAAPPGGNLSGLGLGNTSTLTDNLPLPPSPPIGPPGGGARPRLKNCVGKPPRQTEDPLSPPCVGYFDGDNGGATYQGVTSNEIRVLFYFDADFTYQDCGYHPATPGYYDLVEAQGPDENTCVGTFLRVWQRFFNERFQTYGRFVHFWLYFAPYGDSTSPQTRRADASDNFNRLHPFAVVPMPDLFYNWGYLDSYQQAMSERGVFYFTSNLYQPSDDYQRYAPLLWGHEPSLEQHARNYASYVCQKIAPYKSSFAGPALNDRARTYGLIKTTDPTKGLLRRFQDIAARYIQTDCGIRFLDTAYYPLDGSAVQIDSTYAFPAMSRFSQKNITTVIWPSGFETEFSRAAGSLRYYPEWVAGGGGEEYSVSSLNATLQNQTVWAHAIVVTPKVRITNSYNVTTGCREAYLSVEAYASGKYGLWYACTVYPAIMQLFTGIQVAGPHLTPAAMDTGYHAIPGHPSSDPETPACFYDPGDYTCVKDGTAMWWDPQMPNPYVNTPGCWRMPLGGRRYLTGRWPRGDASTQRSSDDPCNGY